MQGFDIDSTTYSLAAALISSDLSIVSKLNANIVMYHLATSPNWTWKKEIIEYLGLNL
jgi:hypothetical protein